ncbi:MAG TPA: NDP-sugar synthase [Syntrophobacteraceae bacterium]|nr:NDP-sugar synthase [Syntrophobacteraceae bacterium]
MKAMILAAGLGTRLRPLTLVRPKPLVPVMGTDLLTYWVHRLHREGFEAVVVNAFHLHGQMVKAVSERPWPLPVHMCVEPRLLGTAGGLRNALDFFGDEPLAVVNSDVICNVSVADLYEDHLRSGCPASLLVHDFSPFNNVVVAQDGRIVQFGDRPAPPGHDGEPARIMAFTGIYCLTPSILSDVPPGHPRELVPLLTECLSKGMRVRAVTRPPFFWREIGTLDSYRRVHRELSLREGESPGPLPAGRSFRSEGPAVENSDLSLRGFVVMGRNCRVGKEAVLEDTILWDHVEVKARSSLNNCIVTDGAVVEGNHANEVILGETGL